MHRPTSLSYIAIRDNNSARKPSSIYGMSGPVCSRRYPSVSFRSPRISCMITPVDALDLGTQGESLPRRSPNERIHF